MKKFVLVLVCTLIILFFVGFNYLLWDRENKVEDIRTLENTNENKDDLIAYLTSERKRVENEKNKLDEEIKALEKKITDLNGQIEKDKESKSALESTLKEVNELVVLLKGQADKQMLAEKVSAYFEFLGNKDYVKAYSLRYNHELGYLRPKSFNDFKAGYENNVESIVVEKIEYISEYAGIPKGMHAFSAELNVQLKEGAVENGSEYVPGINVFIFVVGFDEKLKDWVIADIMPPGS